MRVGSGEMTDTHTHLRLRNRLLASIGLFVYLAVLAIWQIDSIHSAATEPIRAFTLGVILGAMTCLGFVIRRRWQLYLASRP